ncbi:MAG TPA: hypothetical protein VHD90_05555 [Phototrophicaceae bacterium]|nr:hypothetical protein [Phototrophicaceae bacterium]
MGLSSLRVRALGVVERTLRRWLDYVEDQLESAEPQAPPAREPFVARQPAPPDHWVERVRQSAPQLLDHDLANADGAVIDYHAPDAPPDASAPLPPARPLRLAPVSPLKPPVNPAQSVTSSAKRPLRLEPVRTQIPAAETLASHSTEVSGASVEPPTIRTKMPPVEPHQRTSQADAALLPLPTHRTDSVANPPAILSRTHDLSHEAQSVREVPTSPGESEPIAAHFAALSDEPSLSSASTSVPQHADIPVVRTRETTPARLNQQRTSVPQTSSQVTTRPTTVPPSLNIEHIQPERWPSLPESPADEMPDGRSANLRRERLLREQEGRAWSE